MTTGDAQLIGIAIQTGGPLVLQWIKGFVAGSGGVWPTAEEMVRANQDHAAAIVSQWDAWKAAHPQT